MLNIHKKHLSQELHMSNYKYVFAETSKDLNILWLKKGFIYSYD